MFHFQATDSTCKTRWDRFLANPGSIRSRSLSLPHFKTLVCSTRTQSLSEASAGSIRSPHKRTHEEAFEHHGAGILTRQPLLEFQLTPTGQCRTWRDVVNRVTFRARLDQQREPASRDNLGMELTEVLRRAIQRQIDNQTGTAPDTRVHFVMQSDAFSHFFRTRVYPRQ